jgi:phosphoenolpyruvate carboxylase
LLQRKRAGGPGGPGGPELASVSAGLAATLNGIAQGLRNTG